MNTKGPNTGSLAAIYRDLLPGVCVIGREAAILQPITTTEVCAAIAAIGKRGDQVIFAAGRQDGLPAGAVGIDLSKMRTVTVDAGAGLVTVQGGCRLRDMDAACKPHGMACVAWPVTYPDIDVVSLSLCGGCGYLSRQHGLAVDNIVSAEVRLALLRLRCGQPCEVKELCPPVQLSFPSRSLVISSGHPTSFRSRAPSPSPQVVLADGTAATATKDNEHSELFGALCGGGSRIAVVVSITMRAHRVKYAFSGVVVNLALTLGSAIAVVRNWATWVDKCPRSVSGACVLACGAPAVSTAIVELAVDQRPTVTPLLRDLPNLVPLSGCGLSGAFGACASFKPVQRTEYHVGTQRMLEGFQRTGHCHRASLIVPALSGQVAEVLVDLTRNRHPNSSSGECSAARARPRRARDGMPQQHRSLLAYTDSRAHSSPPRPILSS